MICSRKTNFSTPKMLEFLRKYMQLVADDCFGIPINNCCRYDTIQLNEPSTTQSENKMHDKIKSNVNICTFNHNLFYRNWNNDYDSFLLAQTHTQSHTRANSTNRIARSNWHFRSSSFATINIFHLVSSYNLRIFNEIPSLFINFGNGFFFSFGHCFLLIFLRFCIFSVKYFYKLFYNPFILATKL